MILSLVAYNIVFTRPYRKRTHPIKRIMKYFHHANYGMALFLTKLCVLGTRLDFTCMGQPNLFLF